MKLKINSDSNIEMKDSRLSVLSAAWLGSGARKDRWGYFIFFIFHISRHKLNFVNNGTEAWHTEFSRSKLVTSVIQSTTDDRSTLFCHLIIFVSNINAKEKFSQSWLASLARPFLFLANERRQRSDGVAVCCSQMAQCATSECGSAQY